MTMVDQGKIREATRLILEAIGEDVTREGLAGTPDRVARFWSEFVDHDPGKLQVTFQGVETDQMVIVSGVKVWSLCEHHLLPFWCELTLGYLATDRVLGLSKLARLAQKHAHRLQLQERLVHGIADELQELAGTEHVAVVGKGQHLCMVMRGVKTEGLMHTSVLRGRFLDQGQARSEFLFLSR